jgi:glutamate synthase (NADPH/NADH) small chain
VTLTSAPDIRAGRLSAADYARNFADARPPLTQAQALLEAERCLYCYDAPCATACPTSIDVPSFIKRIADGNLRGSARTILEANPLGGMCARVCPTENLCEAVCVRNTQEGKPVQIGRLQRPSCSAALNPPVRPWPWWAPARPAWPVPTPWRDSATRWWCTTHNPRPAA